MEDITVLGCIGRGASGVTVYDCVNKKNHRKLCLKKIPKVNFSRSFFEHEVNINKSLLNANVAKIVQNFETENSYAILIERGDCDLMDYVISKGPIGEEEVMKKFLGVIQTIEYMHSINLLHNDIKLENILVVGNEYKLIDFGLSEFLNDSNQSNRSVGSPFYLAPEISQRKPHGKSSDIYSLGVSLFAALCGQFPYDAENSFEYRSAQLAGNVDLNVLEGRNISSRIIDLISKMLDPVPSNRPTIKECIEIGWNNVW